MQIQIERITIEMAFGSSNNNKTNKKKEILRIFKYRIWNRKQTWAMCIFLIHTSFHSLLNLR